MQWASAMSLAARLEDAVDEALDTIAEELEVPPDLLFCFAHPEYADHFTRLSPQVAERYPDAAIAGCSASGVIGGGREVEFQPALSIAAASLPGVSITPFHLGSDADEWRSRIDVDRDELRGLVLLPDPFTCRTIDVLRWLDASYPGCPKVGGLVSGGTAPGTSALFWGGRLERTGAVGVALSGALDVGTVVAQGCRPIGSPAFATRVEGNVIFEIDGQPALEVLEGLHTQLSARDQELARYSLFIGLVMEDSRQVYRHGDFLIRNIAGVDPEHGVIAVGAHLEDNQVLQFHLRDRKTSAQELTSLVEGYAGPDPLGGLMFTCMGRGMGLYGVPDHDLGIIEQALGPISIGGFFCNGEIGPVGGRTHLHGYTTSLALFSPR